MISRGIEETNKIAKEFIKILKPNKALATVVGLYGDLGAGKTTFTNSLAKTLGVKRKVSSPTYVIIKNYKLQTKDYELLFHIDAYRLKNEKELIQLGWEKIISNPKHLVFVEWPENIIKSMPKKHHQIHISHLATGHTGTKDSYRKFKIKKA
jgi:tRNA threonylcarbamoyladenosine biosynthesis protein TsaE